MSFYSGFFVIGIVLVTLLVTGQLTECPEQRGCSTYTIAWMDNVLYTDSIQITKVYLTWLNQIT